MKERCVEIAGRRVGEGQPAWIVAEMSANHNGDYDAAVEILKAAKEAGVNLVPPEIAK